MNTSALELPPAPAGNVPPQAPGVLLVDDHELVRLGFRALVQVQKLQPGQPELVLYEAAALAEALAIYRVHGAGIAVVVLDLALPDANGFDSLMVFRRKYPRAPLVVLSGTEDGAAAHNALALGALAFFPKSGDLGVMLDFVQACVLHGPDHARRHAPNLATPLTEVSKIANGGLAATGPMQSLSTRQLQILQWLLQGKSNREISELACLSEGTVKNHVSMLLLSFAVRSRAQLISKLRT